MSDTRLPTIEDVRAAAERIKPFAIRTPLVRHPVLDERAGGRVFLKAESLQRVGAFKFRGAYNKIAQLDATRWPGGVVACSSGNHAQGVAEASRLCGLHSAVVMPRDAPRMKVERTRQSGGEVVFYDRAREDRERIALALCAEREAAFVHPFDDPDVVAGQGTVGLEIVEDFEAAASGLDAVVVPCSGGGLVSGISLPVKARYPDAQLHTVEPRGFDDMARSLEMGVRQRNEKLAGSIADALMAQSPGLVPFRLARERLARGLVVDDEDMRDAVRFAFHHLKLVLEPGGAAGLAAVLAGRLPTKGRTIVVVLSGGNIDPETLAEILEGEPSAASEPL